MQHWKGISRSHVFVATACVLILGATTVAGYDGLRLADFDWSRSVVDWDWGRALADFEWGRALVDFDWSRALVDFEWGRALAD